MRLLEQFSLNTVMDKPIGLTILVALLLIILIFISLRPTLNEFFKERRINKAIQHLGSQYLKQAILPDGIGGSIFVDYLILAQDSIIVIILKRFRGTIFCAENIEQWTQLIGNRSYKFPNILQHLDSDISSIHALVKDVDVSGLVIFSGDCEFPKGKPEKVKCLHELSKAGINNQLHSEKLINAWYKLKQMSENHLSTQTFADDYFKDKDVKTSYWQPLSLIFILLVWLVWRINFAT